MCLTIPLKIISINNGKAQVSNPQNNVREIDIALIKKPKIGDWILANANIALKKISKKDAEEILNCFN